VPSLLILQSLILHIFPTTRAIPERQARKLEEKIAAENAATAEKEAEKADVQAAEEAKAAKAAVPPARRAPKRRVAATTS